MDRRTLAYLALGGSLLLCLPFGCFSGILSAVGAGALLFSNIETGATAADDTIFTAIFGGIALMALVPGAILLYWAIRTLRGNEAE